MSREERTRSSKLLDRENMACGEQQGALADEGSRHLTANSEALMKLFGKGTQEIILDENETSSGLGDAEDQLTEKIEKEEVVVNSELQNMQLHPDTMRENRSSTVPDQNVNDSKQQDINNYKEIGAENQHLQIQEHQQYQSSIPKHTDRYAGVEQKLEQVPPYQQSQVVPQYESEQSVSLYQDPKTDRMDQYRSQVNQGQPIRQTQQVPPYQQSQVVPQYELEQPVPLYQDPKTDRMDQYSPQVNQGQPIRQTQHEPPYQQQKSTGKYTYRSIGKPEASYKSFKKQIIAVHSPKGGVGKTTISKELTFGLGSARVNNELLKILVVDGDWEFGDVATQFDISPVPNVSEWVREMRYDREQNGSIPIYSKEEISDRFIIHYNENIDILAGSNNASDAMLLDADIVSAILDNLRHCDYDFIIVDNANSLKDITIVPLQKADTIVLVETLDTTTVQETTTMLETLRSVQFDFSKIRMVLNQVPTDDKKLDIGVAEIPRVLKIELTAVLPYYDKVRLYNNAGEAAVLDRETPFSKEIKKIINTIMPIYNTKPKGLLARLFNRKR